MQNIFNNISLDHWIIKFLFIIFLIVLINLFTRVILGYLKKQSSKTYNMWDDCVIDSIYKPFTFLVWIMGIIFSLEFLNNDIDFITISEDFISNVKRTGQLITLDYDEVIYKFQPYATRVENVTPFLVMFYRGTIELEPDTDIWIDSPMSILRDQVFYNCSCIQIQ